MSGNNDFASALDSLIPFLGGKAVDKAKEELDSLAADADDPTQALVLSLVADAVEELGPEGVKVARREVNKLLRGESPNIEWANPRTASDAIAVLQNAEREKKRLARDAVRKAGHILGKFGSIFFKAAVSGALGK
jgi:hypothetical protein